MKNVLRRAIELLNLLSDNENLTTENIKDSISDYRDLNQQAFRRSFERDKNLLRSFGYLIQYENDKWSYDKGYSLSGYSIYESIIKSDKISSEKLINTYLYLKKYLSNSNYDSDKSEIISKILQSINEKRRVGFDYLEKYRKVKPQGLKYFDSKWYLAGEENGSLKTFNLDQIHNLKIGNKADLFQIENKNFPFSWDDEKYSIEATIKLKKDLYDVNKNIFAHNQTQLEIKDEFLHCNVSTNDSYGFIKFLLLLDDEIEIIKINSTVNLKELLDVKKN
ncbi:MAG: helix-turn-helix transcriptional regulator [Candidatus Actinomarina sp.]